MHEAACELRMCVKAFCLVLRFTQSQFSQVFPAVVKISRANLMIESSDASTAAWILKVNLLISGARRKEKVLSRKRAFLGVVHGAPYELSFAALGKNLQGSDMLRYSDLHFTTELNMCWSYLQYIYVYILIYINLFRFNMNKYVLPF